MKNDARMGAPTSARVTEAQMIRTGKPETASPAVEGPIKDKREKQTLPTPTPRAEKGPGTGRRKDRNMHSKNNTKTKFSTYVYVHTRLIHSSRIDEVPEHVVWILPTLPAGEPTVRVVVVRLIAHRFVPVIIPISTDILTAITRRIAIIISRLRSRRRRSGRGRLRRRGLRSHGTQVTRHGASKARAQTASLHQPRQRGAIPRGLLKPSQIHGRGKSNTGNPLRERTPGAEQPKATQAKGRRRTSCGERWGNGRGRWSGYWALLGYPD